MSKNSIKPSFAYVYSKRIIFKDDFVIPFDNCIIYEFRDGKYRIFCNVIYGEL